MWNRVPLRMLAMDSESWRIGGGSETFSRLEKFMKTTKQSTASWGGIARRRKDSVWTPLLITLFSLKFRRSQNVRETLPNSRPSSSDEKKLKMGSSVRIAKPENILLPSSITTTSSDDLTIRQRRRSKSPWDWRFYSACKESRRSIMGLSKA